MSETLTTIEPPDPEQILQRLAELVAQSEARWLTVKGSADHASLSPESIRRLLASGKLTGHRPVRGRVLIDREQLDHLIATSTAEPRRGRGKRK